MPVEVGAPLEATRKRQHSYAEFIDALAKTTGEWVSLPFDEISGSTGYRKQTSIQQAVKSRGLHCTTTIQDERIYARLLT